MLGFVLSLLIAFQGASTPAAGSTLADELAAAAVYAGQEAHAAREFRAGDDAESERGIRLVQTSVRVFDASDEAADALTEFVATNLESDAFAGLDEQDSPGLGDDSQAYAGELPNGAFVGIVFVVQETRLYRFIAASAGEDPLPELLDEAEAWIDDAANEDDAEALDLLPDEDEVLAGFTLSDEGSVTSDGEARPATPVA